MFVAGKLLRDRDCTWPTFTVMTGSWALSVANTRKSTQSLVPGSSGYLDIVTMGGRLSASAAGGAPRVNITRPFADRGLSSGATADPFPTLLGNSKLEASSLYTPTSTA